MLSIIQQQLGGQPLNIVSAAADEILAVLKNDAIKHTDKKKEIEKLVNSISPSVFDSLVNSGKLITDYQEGGDAAPSANGDGLDNEVGVAVEFEENDDDDDDSDLGSVQDEEEEDEDLAEACSSEVMQMGGDLLEVTHEEQVK